MIAAALTGLLWCTPPVLIIPNMQGHGQYSIKRNTIAIRSGLTEEEQRYALFHECGHFLDHAVAGTTGVSPFTDKREKIATDDPSVEFYRLSWRTKAQKTKASKKSDFVSDYATNNPFEDFAETFAHWKLRRPIGNSETLRRKINSVREMERVLSKRGT